MYCFGILLNDTAD